MAEVTKDDINRIYDKLDPMAEDIAAIKMQLEMTPPPPKQPCIFLESHLEEDAERKSSWQKSAIRAVVDVVKIAIIAAAVYIFAKD